VISLHKKAKTKSLQRRVRSTTRISHN